MKTNVLNIMSPQALHFAVTCLEGTNLGPGLVLMLQEAGLIQDLADFFKLTEVRSIYFPPFTFPLLCRQMLVLHLLIMFPFFFLYIPICA